ncbi:hypothetical protein E1258_09620 [Micromonospora sp. KC207]|uniref:hypothetical protein n=1 Tax=Micromonospora sp. KC207 TaxID=2530377 RepID=UPI00104B41D2|nr:hypothetical protein [Micromonospora sp. KC207]TDC63894.1 hypothetical protein E1258_09620 [Micromonospora sp. KC207]
MADRPRSPSGRYVRTLDAAERDAEACRLRARGLSYREIAEQLRYADAAGAHRAVQKVLRDTVQEPADELRHLEVVRLDALLAVAWDVLEREHVAHSGGKLVMVAGEDGVEVPLRDDAPTLAAIDRVLKIMTRRAELLGLDAPRKIEQGGQVKYIVEGVDLGALT